MDTYVGLVLEVVGYYGETAAADTCAVTGSEVLAPGYIVDALNPASSVAYYAPVANIAKP